MKGAEQLGHLRTFIDKCLCLTEIRFSSFRYQLPDASAFLQTQCGGNSDNLDACNILALDSLIARD